MWDLNNNTISGTAVNNLMAEMWFLGETQRIRRGERKIKTKIKYTFGWFVKDLFTVPGDLHKWSSFLPQITDHPREI